MLKTLLITTFCSALLNMTLPRRLNPPCFSLSTYRKECQTLFHARYVRCFYLRSLFKFPLFLLLFLHFVAHPFVQYSHNHNSSVNPFFFSFKFGRQDIGLAGALHAPKDPSCIFLNLFSSCLCGFYMLKAVASPSLSDNFMKVKQNK